MFDKDLVQAWLRQAKADLGAAEQPPGGSKECHRRYWLQQANETCIKALGLIIWQDRPSEQTTFKKEFLNKHSPIKNLAGQPDLSRAMKMLIRQLETELATLDGSGLLLRVDATTPTINPNDTSYRYPFVDASGQQVAPADWSEPDWDAYQGNFQGVLAAIKRLFHRVENLRITAERRPG